MGKADAYPLSPDGVTLRQALLAAGLEGSTGVFSLTRAQASLVERLKELLEVDQWLAKPEHIKARGSRQYDEHLALRDAIAEKVEETARMPRPRLIMQGISIQDLLMGKAGDVDLMSGDQVVVSPGLSN